MHKPSIRELFPFFKGAEIIYLDSAATAHKPHCVIDTMTQFLSTEYATVHRAIYPGAVEVSSRYRQVREKIRQAISAQRAEEIIFTKSTTEAINLVAFCLGKAFLQKGDEILLTETEHHANILPWQKLCREKGCILRVIPVDDQGDISIHAFSQMLHSGVKVVAIGHISNVTGAIHPIETVIHRAHQVGAIVLVDAAQSVAHMPLDVSAWDVDFLVFSGHKMYGPTGVGVLYGKYALLEQMPPFLEGGDMIAEVFFSHSTYQLPPLRFEAGTPPITEVLGLGAAWDFLLDIGWKTIALHDHMLTSQLVEGLKMVPGVRLLAEPARQAPVVSFTIDGFHPLDVGTLLGYKGVCVRTGHLCAQPALRRLGGHSSVLRASIGIYNRAEEIERFLFLLQEVLKQLQK